MNEYPDPESLTTLENARETYGNLLNAFNEKNELDRDLDELNAELTSANNQLAENAKSITALTNETESQKELAKTTANEYANKLKDAQQVTEAAVAAKAAELMCNQAEPPAPEPGSEENAIKTKEKLMEEYKSLETPKERQAFRNAHAKKLI